MFTRKIYSLLILSVGLFIAFVYVRMSSQVYSSDIGTSNEDYPMADKLHFIQERHNVDGSAHIVGKENMDVPREHDTMSGKSEVHTTKYSISHDNSMNIKSTRLDLSDDNYLDINTTSENSVPRFSVNDTSEINTKLRSPETRPNQQAMTGGVNNRMAEYFDNSTTSTYELIPNVTSSRPHTFVIYIMSAMSHLDNRMAIRRTWANIDRLHACAQHGFHVERMFVVGGLRFVDHDTAERMRNESKAHRDILTLDELKDNYLNLTKKTLYAMYWINDNLNLDNVDYMMKADDDILMNTFYILRLAWSELQAGESRDFFCAYLRRRLTPRWGRWAEQRSIYPNEHYPEMCQGPAYTLHARVFPMMLQCIPRVPIMHNEDAMLTGVCMKNRNINRYRIPRDRIIKNKQDMIEKRRGINRKFEEIIHAHGLPISEWDAAFDIMNSTRITGDFKADFKF